MIRNQIGRLIVGVLFAGWSLAALARLSATVDQNQVSENDLVTLTVRLDNERASGSPDYSVLRQNFVIVQQSGPNQSSEFSFINGKQSSETHTDWTVVLQPRKTGKLTIPPITLGNETTQPITIDVVQGSAAPARSTNQWAFFQTSVDHDTVYVQGQIIYTVKLFYGDSIAGHFPPPPNVQNAVVETAQKEKRYQSFVGTHRYNVLEKRYAIYPQTSGQLFIPRQRFNGTRGSTSFFSPSQPVSAVSQPHTIHVNPKPAAFTGQNWLPAKSLTLTESWGQGRPSFKVGEPINRVLTLTAKGVASSLLPPFPKLNLDNAKTYADPPNTTDQPSATDGIISTESTTVGIVPTKPGELTLPEIRIPWWNTETNKLEAAVIPAETYHIAAAPGSAVTVPQTLAPSTPVPGQVQPTQVVTYLPSTLWLYVLAAIILLWLATTWLWLYTRQRLKSLSRQATPDQPLQNDPAINEKDAWEMFERACKSNNASRVSTALFIWATTRYPAVNSLSDLAKLDGSELGDEITQLDNALYSSEATESWQGDRLLAAVKALRDTKSGKPKHTALAPTLNPG